MKRYLLTVALICGLVLGGYAQESERNHYVDIQTPNVASFMKSIDNPVGLYHGNPEISHTLYTLTDGTIELPITLQYNASGIKVKEEASWVGLGWNLNVGGVVVQTPVGQIDKRYDYTESATAYTSEAPFTYYKQLIYNQNDKNIYNGFYSKGMENRLQPDVYYFCFPGGSGKFFIDYRDNSVHLLDDSTPLKVEQIATGWQITTSEGIVHLFNLHKTTNYTGSNLSYGNTYYLTQTIYPNGQSVEYNYSFNEVITYHYWESKRQILQIAQYAVPSTDWYENKGTEIYHSDEGTLTSIQTTNYSVNFYNSERDDLLGGYKLDSITIIPKEWSTPNKRFKFAYDYFISSDTGNKWFRADTEQASKRLKLLSVCEYNVSGNENDKLKFDYHTTELPMKNSFAVDYWGYYNGQISNTGITPYLKYLLTDKTTLSWVQANGNALRAFNSSTCQAGMLKKVTYPTGGYMEYTYEPHEYASSVFIPTVDELNSSIVTKNARCQNSPYDQNVVSVNTAKGAQIDIKFRIEKGLNTWAQMEGCKYLLERCPEDSSSYFIIAEKTFNFSSQTNAYYEENYSLLSAGGIYRLTISLPSTLGDQNGSNTNHGNFLAEMKAPIPTVTTRKYNYGGGVRVKRVDYHDGIAGTADYSLYYSYPNPDVYAISFIPLQFYRQYNNLNYMQMTYDQNGNPNSLNEGLNGSEVDISSDNMNSAPYSNIGNTVGYGQIKVSKEGSGSSVYTFVNRNEVNIGRSCQIPYPGNGKLISVYHYNKNGECVESETNTYKTELSHFYYGVTIHDHFNFSPMFYNNLVERYELLDFGDYDGRYETWLYELSSYRNLLIQKVNMKDGVTTTTDYEYDNYKQLKKQILTSSDGKVHAKSYTYPYNYNCTPYTAMAEKHMYAYPVEVKEYTNGLLTGSTLKQYQNYNGLYLPLSISRGKFTAPMTDCVTFSCSGALTTYYPVADVTYLT